MKRDLDICRRILLWAESNAEGWYVPDFGDFPTDTMEDVSYNAALLGDAGLLDIKKSMNSVIVGGLTWQGHEFLDASRDEGIWAKTKAAAVEKGRALPFEVVKTLVIELAKRAALSAVGL